MIDNMRSTIARIQAIQTTITGRTGAEASELRAGTGADAQAMFSELLRQAGRGAPASLARPPLTNTALTPAAGTVRNGPPPGLQGYANGRIPLAALAPLTGSDERLWAPAAAAFEHMRRDAALAGVDLPIVDGYRPLEDQIRLASELGLYSEGGLAAEPGTSQHGWGRALDLEVDDRSVAWLRTHAWKYGFVETVPREPWHWEFHPAG